MTFTIPRAVCVYVLEAISGPIRPPNFKYFKFQESIFMKIGEVEVCKEYFILFGDIHVGRHK